MNIKIEKNRVIEFNKIYILKRIIYLILIFRNTLIDYFFRKLSLNIKILLFVIISNSCKTWYIFKLTNENSLQLKTGSNNSFKNNFIKKL
jgi:hypothetical protein